MADKKRRAGEKKGRLRPDLNSRTVASSGSARLYTQCPGCKTRYRITVTQLRCGRGEVLCQACLSGFNAIDSLAESPTFFPADTRLTIRPPTLGRLETVPPAGEGKPLPLSTGDEPGKPATRDEAPRSSQAAPIGWAIGALSLIVLLGVQLGLFEGPRLIQNERLRPWLETACQTLDCRLPPFHAPKQIQIVERALNPAPDGYQFSLVVSNQASLPQAFPAIKLNLAAHDGSPAASRLFQPEDYLAEKSQAIMEVGKLYEIHLLLAKPGSEVEGFSFELL